MSVTTRRVRRPGAWVAGLACAIAIAPRSAAAERDGVRGALVTAPASWRTDPEQATALAQRFAAVRHLGGLAVVTAAEAYVADRPGVALFATRATASLAEAAQAARAALAALDELRGSTRRAQLSGGTPAEESWQERVDADPRQVAATLSWRDPASQTRVTARLVIASDGERIAAVTGECLASEAADPALVTACRTALATLDPGIAAARRVVLAPAAPGATAADAEPPARVRAPARLDDASRIVFPPTAIPQPPREPDRRPVYLGAGVIALALMFWWNRRRRDRFDHEERGAPRTPRDDADDLRAAAGAPQVVDEDADDLHAAARGEPPDRTDDREDRKQAP